MGRRIRIVKMVTSSTVEEALRTENKRLRAMMFAQNEEMKRVRGAMSTMEIAINILRERNEKFSKVIEKQDAALDRAKKLILKIKKGKKTPKNNRKRHKTRQELLERFKKVS